MGDTLKKALQIRKITDKIMINDPLMETLLDMVGSKRVGELMTCHIPFLVKIGSPIVNTYLKLFSEKH